jgi:predicted Zn-dependent protease
MELKGDKDIKYILFQKEGTTIHLNDSKPDIPVSSNNTTLSIDLIKDCKRVKGNIETLSEKTIKEKIKELKSTSKYINRQFFSEFPGVERQTKDFKTDCAKFDLEEITKEMIELNKDLKEDKNIKKVTATINNTQVKKKQYSKEIEYGNIVNELYLNIGVIYKDKDTSGHYVEKLTLKDYNLEELHKKLKKNIESEKNPVSSKEHYTELIFTPKVFSQLIDHFILENLNIEDIKLHNNFISKKFGQELFDKKLNILEDPFVDNSPFSEKYDYEFSRTTKKEIIKNGIPKSYFVDLDNSYKYKEETTGNKFSELEPTNLIITPGTKKLDKIISETKKGIIIREIIGLHTSNSKEGSLNVAVNIANEIIDGKIKRNVKNIPLSIKIHDLFTGIELSKETEEEHNVTTPYLVKRI